MNSCKKMIKYQEIQKTEKETGEKKRSSTHVDNDLFLIRFYCKIP